MSLRSDAEDRYKKHLEYIKLSNKGILNQFYKIYSEEHAWRNAGEFAIRSEMERRLDLHLSKKKK